MVKPKSNILATLLDLEKDMARHKKYRIAETIKDLQEWGKLYDDHPIDYRNYRWNNLKRRLKNLSDMEQELKYLRYQISKEEK